MTSARAIVVRRYEPASDEVRAEELLDEHLGGRWQARRAELHDVLAPGLALVAEVDGRLAGLLTWRLEVEPQSVELSAIVASPPGQGIGGALLDTFVAVVGSIGRSRIRVVTTNDNLDALRFYQRRGFVLVELRVGAVDGARRTIKPAIGLVGAYGIPLRDELELERIVGPTSERTAPAIGS